MAKAKEELVKQQETLEGLLTDLEGLSQEAADLHGECDYTLKNFEVRQAARMKEMEALKMVKAILSGAKFSNFLQSKAFPDDGSRVASEDETPEEDPLNAFLSDDN